MNGTGIRTSEYTQFKWMGPLVNVPEAPQKTYLMMEHNEMIRYIEFLQERLDEEKRARELSDKRFEEESAARKEADKRVFDLLGKIDRMGEQPARDEEREDHDCTSENAPSSADVEVEEVCFMAVV